MYSAEYSFNLSKPIQLFFIKSIKLLSGIVLFLDSFFQRSTRGPTDISKAPFVSADIKTEKAVSLKNSSDTLTLLPDFIDKLDSSLSLL